MLLKRRLNIAVLREPFVSATLLIKAMVVLHSKMEPIPMRVGIFIFFTFIYYPIKSIISMYIVQIDTVPFVGRAYRLF